MYLVMMIRMLLKEMGIGLILFVVLFLINLVVKFDVLIIIM